MLSKEGRNVALNGLQEINTRCERGGEEKKKEIGEKGLMPVPHHYRPSS